MKEKFRNEYLDKKLEPIKNIERIIKKKLIFKEKNIIKIERKEIQNLWNIKELRRDNTTD